MIKRTTLATEEQANKIKEVIEDEINNINNWVQSSKEPRKRILNELLKWFSDEKNLMKIYI